MLHKKERPSTYEKPLEVDLTFDELLEIAVSVPPPSKGEVLESEESEKGKPVLVRKGTGEGEKKEKKAKARK